MEMIKMWREYPDLGSVYEDNRLVEPDLQPVATFLREVIELFARSSAKFYAEIRELPFIYRELQIHSELLPAIHEVADVVMVEQAVERKLGHDFSSGRLDYVMRYQKTFVFFIELKFAWIAAKPKGEDFTQELEDAWLEAQRQLKSIRPQYLKEFAQDLGVMDPKKLIQVVLLIAPCYESSKDDEKLKAYDQSIVLDVNNRLMDGLPKKYSPNLGCVWAVPDRFQKPLWIDDWYEIFPCVAFIARAKTLKLV